LVHARKWCTVKQIKSVEQVISEMNATTNYEALGIAPPNPQRVAELVRGMSEEIERIESSLPKPWDEMTIEEQNQWFAEMGIGELTASEMAEQFGGEGHATVIFFGTPHPPWRRGSIVAVQHPDGSWHNQMRAVNAADGLVYVTEDEEYRRAERDDREPLTIAYPQERVKLADGQ
jgi:hypothetical protein